MPSDQRNLIMAKATGLIFPLFDVTSTREVPFWHIAVRTMHSPGTYHCPPFIFADSKRVNLVVARDGFLCITRNCP